MQPVAAPFHETGPWSGPIRDLGLSLAGSPLEPVLEAFGRELDGLGLAALRPRFYLSTEWGVPEGTIAIAIPFYLAHPELTALQADRAGHVEGASPGDILRYLRHEMGHVVNYAYRLYEQEEWAARFGPFAAPYREEYAPEPFSRRFVHHLPGWYAQKHPDEDWAETFAVWMTPGSDWRAAYGEWPEALAKLEFCDRTMKGLAGRPPVVTADELDEDVGDLPYTLSQYYEALDLPPGPPSPGLDVFLRALFDDARDPAGPPRRPAADLIRRRARPIAAAVYRWTGQLPERSLAHLRLLARRAEALALDYPEPGEDAALIGLTAFLAAWASRRESAPRPDA